MENQHRKISGYRELNQEEIDLMNEIKSLGPQIEVVVAKAERFLEKQKYDATDLEKERIEAAMPSAFLENGTMSLKTGLMQITRAIAQPTFF